MSQLEKIFSDFEANYFILFFFCQQQQVTSYTQNLNHMNQQFLIRFLILLPLMIFDDQIIAIKIFSDNDHHHQEPNSHEQIIRLKSS